MAAATVVTVVGASSYVRQISGGDYTVGRFDKLIEVDASGAASVVTLPDPALLGGEIIAIVRTAGIINAITVSGTGGPFVIATPLLSCGLFISNGSSWRRVGAI